MTELLGYLELSPLFRQLDPALLADLASRARQVGLPSGQLLFRQGDPGDALYVVASGRLRALAHDESGERPIVDLGRGEVIGELAVVTGEPRSASIRAVRDSTLVRIDKEDFDSLLDRHPAAMMCLARIIVQRLQHHSVSRARDALLSTRTLAVLPAHSPALPLDAFAGELTRALSQCAPTRHLHAGAVDAELGAGHAQSTFAEPEHNQRLLRWLNDLEGSTRYIVYEADARPSAWSARCLRQADRVLLVVDAVRKPEASAALAFLQEQGVQAPIEVVLVHHGRRALNYDAVGWRQLCGAVAHHHVITGREEDVPRLARLVTGRALGVVFSGGGARGFAHLGLIRALAERGMTVDLAGGTSMGAFVSAMLALGLTLPDMLRVMRELFVDHNYLNDYSLSRLSLISGQKFRKRLKAIFGESRIEDLDLPYFCVSTNLTRGSIVVHEAGRLTDWVSTSMTVPGVGPPVVYQGDLLVDGGLLNNLPTDIMQARGRGRVLASDVSSAMELRVEGVDTSEPTDLLRLKAAAKAFSMARILFRSATLVDQDVLRQRAASADVYIRMPVQGIGMFEWKALDSLMELGYRHTLQTLDARQEQGQPAG